MTHGTHRGFAGVCASSEAMRAVTPVRRGCPGLCVLEVTGIKEQSTGPPDDGR